MENKLKTVDAETLLSTPMSKTMFIVDNLIPQGVNVISGASKIGKSWLMLWLGLQVAQGLPVWGLTTQQCDVLYLSLEDTQRRIKDRLYNLTDTAPSNLYFAVMCGLDRRRTGGTDYRFFKRPPENKACNYRYFAKGSRRQRWRRQDGNVRKRLR